MQLRTIRKILKDTDFVHFSATAEETQVARYLQEMAEKLGAQRMADTVYPRLKALTERK